MSLARERANDEGMEGKRRGLSSSKAAEGSSSRRAKRIPLAAIEKQQARVRLLCLALPEASEKLSHGEPTFFVNKRVFAQMSTDHHDDGHLAVVIPLREGEQEVLLERDPATYYVPPYVGVRGWIGIELSKVSERLLKQHLREAWRLVAPKRLVSSESPR